MKALLRLVLDRAGRRYEPDPSLSSVALGFEIVRRFRQILIGLFRTGSMVFLGRNVRLRNRSNIAMGRLASIGDYSSVDGLSQRGVQLGRGSKLGRFVTVTGTSHLGKKGYGFELGDGSAIGDFGHVGCSGGVLIGKDVIVGPYSTFHSQEHRTDRTDIPIRSQGTTESRIEIEDDVWLGARVTVLAGSVIRTGTVVAAGSVVKGKFPPNSVLAGTPARVVKSRLAKSG